MSKLLKIFLNLALSILIIVHSLILYPQQVKAAPPECKAVGVLIQPSKIFNKDNDDISFTVSLTGNGSAIRTIIPSDHFIINTQYNKTWIPDQITGKTQPFSFNRDNNQLSVQTKLDLVDANFISGHTWPIGQYEVRMQKDGVDYCTTNPALFVAPAQLVEAGNCSYSLPGNIHYGDGYQITDFQLTNVPGVIYTPLLFEGNKRDSDFTFATERDVAHSLGLTAKAGAIGAGLGAGAAVGISAASAVAAGAAAGAGIAGVPTLGIGAPVGAIVGAGLGLVGGVIYNFMSTEGFRDAVASAEKYIIFDKDVNPPKLEIKNNIPTRDDGYTLVMSVKLGGIRGPGNQYGTACWVNRFKVTTDPTSAVLRSGTYKNTENPTHAQTTTPETAPILAKAGGKTCGDDVESGISTAIGCIHTQPVEFVKDFMKFAIGISGGLAFLMMLFGAFQMITSAGNAEALKAGQDRLTSAVIGLLFVIFATLLLQIIGVDILKIFPK